MHHRTEPIEPTEWELDMIEAQAEEELLTDTKDFSAWLFDACDCDEAEIPLNVMQIHESKIQGAPVHVLLALIMCGTDKQANLARMFLREAWRLQYAHVIDRRFRKLLADPAALNWY